MHEIIKAENSIAFMSSAYGGGFDRTYIDNGVLQTVPQSTIDSCNSLYDAVSTCLTNHVQDPSAVSTCGSGSDIFFDPGNGVCATEILAAIGFTDLRPVKRTVFRTLRLSVRVLPA